MSVLLATLGLASAGSSQLAVEHARAAILESRPVDAMVAVDEARRTDWFALRLYLRACSHAGLMPLCDVEYQKADGWVGFVWRWHHAERSGELPAVDDCEGEVCSIGMGWSHYYAGSLEQAGRAVARPITHPNGWRLRMRVARKSEDDRELAALASAFQKAVPRHPQVLSELFIGGFDGRHTKKARKRAVRHARGLSSPDDVLRFRQLRFAMSAGLDDWAESLADALETADGRPATRKPYNPAMEKALGSLLARTESPEVRGPTGPDRLAVAAVLSRRLVESGRGEEAARVWEATRSEDDSSSAASEHAGVLLQLGQRVAAHAAANEGLRLAAGAVWDDAARLDRSRWAAELAEAFAIRARAGEGAQAAVDAVVARRLLPSERMDRLVEEVGVGDLKGLPSGDEPWARAARLCLEESAEDWRAHRAWVDPRSPRFAHVAELHARGLDGVDTPAIRAVREAFTGGQAPVDDDRVEVGRRFPLDLLGLEPGTPAIISAWASWCGPCRKELPELDELVAELRAAGKPIQAVALSVDAQEVVYRKSLARFRFGAMRAVRSPEIGADLETGALPTLWLVDARGVVTGIRVGYSEGALSAVRELAEGSGRR